MAKTYRKTFTAPDGKRVYLTGKTKKEVEHKYLIAMFNNETGLYEEAVEIDVADHTTVGELANLWFKTFKAPRLRPRSADTLRGILDRYIIPVIGKKEVRDVKPLDVQKVMNGVAKMAKSTQSKVLQAVTNIFRLAVDEGIIDRSPVISTIKAGGPPAKVKVALTPDQMLNVVKAAEGTPAYLFVLIGLYAGLRRGEILGLKWEDIDFDAGTIHVARSITYSVKQRRGAVDDKLKSPAADRVIPVPPFLSAALQGAKATSKSEWVLSMARGQHYSESAFGTLWRHLKANPVIDRDDLTPHLLRHTCATRWFEQGLDIKEIQYLLGHATIDMTMGLYTHYDRASRAELTAEKIRAVSPPSIALM